MVAFDHDVFSTTFVSAERAGSLGSRIQLLRSKVLPFELGAAP